MSGRPKASVFPDPVRALPQTSRPLMASAMVSVWMGVGSTMPPRRRTWTRSLATPRSSNELVTSGLAGAGEDVPPRGSATVEGVRWVSRKMDSVELVSEVRADGEPPQITATMEQPRGSTATRHSVLCYRAYHIVSLRAGTRWRVEVPPLG